MTDETIPMASVTCPECGDVISHVDAKVLPRMLGLHRKRAHGIAGSSPKKRPRGGRPPIREEQPAPVRVAKAMAEEISPTATTAPSVADLTKALARGIGTLSTLGAAYAAETDPTISTEEDRDAVTDYLSLSPDAAKEIAYPFARVFGRTKLNKRYGRTVVDNIDVVSAGAELVQYAVRWRRYLGERRRRQGLTPPAPEPRGEVVRSAPVVTTFPTPGTGEMAMTSMSVPAMNGHVVDAAEAARLRGER